MALPDIRQRAGYLFIAVTVGDIILISAQVNTDRGVPMLEAVTFGVFAEIQRAASSAIGSVRTSWSDYLALQQVQSENKRLEQEVATLQITLQQERALAQRTRTLEQLLELRSEAALATLAAGVIAGSASPEFRTITIDKGTAYGLRPDMAVIAPAGVVGRQLYLDADRMIRREEEFERTSGHGNVSFLVEKACFHGLAAIVKQLHSHSGFFP